MTKKDGNQIYALCSFHQDLNLTLDNLIGKKKNIEEMFSCKR